MNIKKSKVKVELQILPKQEVAQESQAATKNSKILKLKNKLIVGIYRFNNILNILNRCIRDGINLMPIFPI
jgi:ubiquitin C-terminal hydrolase